MEIIQDPECNKYRLDDDARLFLLKVGDDYYAVSARTDFMAGIAIGLAQRTGDVPDVATKLVGEVSRMYEWPRQIALAGDGSAGIGTLIVRPVHDETELYILPLLPAEVLKQATTPRGDPGAWRRGNRNFTSEP